MFRKILVTVLFCLAGVSSADEPLTNALPVEIVSAEFGLFSNDNPHEKLFEPTTVVPHRQGQRYGWVIELRSAKRSLSVSEEYLLPNPAKTQKAPDLLGESLNVAFERHSQVSQRQLVPVDGKIYGEWEVGPNEPAGHRHLQVIIEGQVAASFEYEVK